MPYALIPHSVRECTPHRVQLLKKTKRLRVRFSTKRALRCFHLCYYLSIFLYYDPIASASTCTRISPNKKIRACPTNLYASTIYPLASLLAFSEFDCARHSGSVLPEFDCVYRYLNSYSRYAFSFRTIFLVAREIFDHLCLCGREQVLLRMKRPYVKRKAVRLHRCGRAAHVRGQRQRPQQLCTNEGNQCALQQPDDSSDSADARGNRVQGRSFANVVVHSCFVVH